MVRANKLPLMLNEIYLRKRGFSPELSKFLNTYERNGEVDGGVGFKSFTSHTQTPLSLAMLEVLGNQRILQL